MKKSRIDRLGRIVIPIQYRKELGLIEDSEVNIEFVDGKVILTASDLICRMCGGYIEKDNDKSIPLCQSCIARIKET